MSAIETLLGAYSEQAIKHIDGAEIIYFDTHYVRMNGKFSYQDLQYMLSKMEDLAVDLSDLDYEASDA